VVVDLVVVFCLISHHSNMKILALFLPIQHCLSSLLFPATLNSDQVEVAGLVEFSTGQEPLRIVFSLASYTRISLVDDSARLARSGPRPSRFSIRDQNNQFNFTDYSSLGRGYTWPSPILFLGIGPTSQFMQQAGSVAFIRHPSNESNVSVGIAVTDFAIHSCIHDSAILVRFDDDHCFDITVRIQRGLSESAEEVFQTCYGSDSIPEELSEYEFFTVPRSIADSMDSRVRHWGANREENEHRFFSFTECDRSILSILPDLELSFISDSITAGRIVLSPADYLLINDEEETCRLRFRLTSNRRNRLTIDLLRFPFINVQLDQH
jgi:hypothetical protein